MPSSPKRKTPRKTSKRKSPKRSQRKRSSSHRRKLNPALKAWQKFIKSKKRSAKHKSHNLKKVLKYYGKGGKGHKQWVAYKNKNL